MGLCLHVFRSGAQADDGPDGVVECDVGPYSDFGYFRDTIARHLDADRYPKLMHHSDCDGKWTPAEVRVLEQELREIGATFQTLPPEEPRAAFKHNKEYRAGAKSLYDCFHDVNGENLFESLLRLCAVARKHRRPINFM
jgi:Immunity protein 70